MFPKLPKILTIIFLAFIIIHTFGFLFLNLFYFPAQAINPSMPKLQIDIPTVNLTDAICKGDVCEIPWIGQYIAGIYKYAIGVVGILAAVVLMVGGIVWLTAGGSATRVGEAKAWIGASLTGLIIALTSYMILYQINPKLTQFEPIKVTQVEKAEDECGGCSEDKECTRLPFAVSGRNYICASTLAGECNYTFDTTNSLNVVKSRHISENTSNEKECLNIFFDATKLDSVNDGVFTYSNFVYMPYHPR